jgi:DNA repair photolyase
VLLTGIARLAASSPLAASKRRVEYFRLPARRFLNRGRGCMPFIWSINPYRGCEFGCKYCFARYTHEFMELDGGREFEEKIYVKQFSAARLREELHNADRHEAIAIGTITDPYQPAERQFGITRRVLEVFTTERGRRLSVTTRSDLILRDLDLLVEIARGNVFHANLSITTLDERLARRLEPLAPRPALRLDALGKLAAAGIKVGVFAMPVLPMLTDSEQNLDSVAAAAADAGASFFCSGVLFLKPCSRRVFFPFLEQQFPELLPRYRALYRSAVFLRGEYAERVAERIERIRTRHALADSPANYSPELPLNEPQQGVLF